MLSNKQLQDETRTQIMQLMHLSPRAFAKVLRSAIGDVIDSPEAIKTVGNTISQAANNFYMNLSVRMTKDDKRRSKLVNLVRIYFETFSNQPIDLREVE